MTLTVLFLIYTGLDPYLSTREIQHSLSKQTQNDLISVALDFPSFMERVFKLNIAQNLKAGLLVFLSTKYPGQ